MIIKNVRWLSESRTGICWQYRLMFEVHSSRALSSYNTIEIVMNDGSIAIYSGEHEGYARYPVNSYEQVNYLKIVTCVINVNDAAHLALNGNPLARELLSRRYELESNEESKRDAETIRGMYAYSG